MFCFLFAVGRPNTSAIATLWPIRPASDRGVGVATPTKKPLESYVAKGGHGKLLDAWKDIAVGQDSFVASRHEEALYMAENVLHLSFDWQDLFVTIPLNNADLEEIPTAKRDDVLQANLGLLTRHLFDDLEVMFSACAHCSFCAAFLV